MIKTDGKGVIEVDVSALKEKLSTDEGVKEVQEAFKGIKGYTGTQFTDILNNYRDSNKDAWNKEWKKEKAIEVLSMREKELKEKYKLQSLEYGKDYNTINELVDKIVVEHSKPAGKTDEEIIKRDARITELTTKLSEMVPKKDFEEAQLKSVKAIVDYEIMSYADKVDEAQSPIDNQLKFLRFTMAEDGIEFGLHKDQPAAFKGGKVLEAADFKPLPLSSVIKEYADKALTLKVPAGGRGGNDKTGHTPTNADLVKIKTIEELSSYLKEKNILTGSPEQKKISDEWLKLQQKT